MKIVSIIPDIGPGGLTSAVLGRSSLLADANEDVCIVLYQYMPNFKKEVQAQIESGKLNPNCSVVNPYDYYDRLFSTKNGYKSEEEIPDHKHVTHNGSEIVETCFDQEMTITRRVIRSSATRNIVKIQFYSTDYTLFKEEIFNERPTPQIVKIYSRGLLTVEKYLSSSGFCYLRQDIDPDTGRISGLWSWDSRGCVKFYRNIWAWRRDFVKNIVCKNSPENLILCDGNNTPPPFLAMKNERFSIVPVIHMNHLTGSGKLRTHYDRYFSRLNEFSGLLCLTQEQASDIETAYEVDIPVFVIANRISNVPKLSESRHASNTDAIIVSRLEKGKGLRDSIKIFRRVVDEVPRATLRIFGSGSLKQELEKLIRSNDLENNVFLMGTTSEPLNEMMRSKVSLFTSESEGFGLTILESMAVGTPVVAYDCKYGPKSLIQDGRSGFVIEGRNAALFSRRVIDLLRETVELDRMSGVAKSSFAENNSDASVLSKWRQMIRVI